jgi:hypothetical protein
VFDRERGTCGVQDALSGEDGPPPRDFTRHVGVQNPDIVLIDDRPGTGDAICRSEATEHAQNALSRQSPGRRRTTGSSLT